MQILIATPLYPPEVADAAVYAKELARRLSEGHEVTVLAYAHLPEELPRVQIITIEKRQSRSERLRAFRHAFAQAVRDTDAVIVVNGASTELPILFSRRTVPLVFCIADKAAHAHGGIVERLSFLRADAIVSDPPPRRPEILPLEPEPTEALAAWDAVWDTHVQALEKIFSHGN